MKIIFLGTGPTEPVEQDSRTRSSIYVETKGSNFIIDCSKDFLKQAKREKIDKIDFFLQTHAHSDATGGVSDLKKWMEESKFEGKMPIYAERQTISKIKNKFNTDHIDFKEIYPYKSFNIENNLKIMPFRLIHSIQPGFPTLGFRFNGVTYSEDVGEIPENSEKFYENAKIVIFDAAMWFERQIKGHFSVDKSLELAKKFNPTNFILIQAGHTYPKQEEAEQKIKEYWSKIKENSKTDVILSYDGLKITENTLITQNLIENREGIIVTEPHGELIWKKEKKMIIRAKYYQSEIGKILYLIAGKKAYGLIKLKNPDKIDMKEFKDLQNLHKITDEEKKKWWPNKQVLYAYKFDIIKLYDNPKKIEYKPGPQTFVKDFEFINEEEELIKDISSYDPNKSTNEQLADDWRIVNAWYSTKKTGGKLKHSLEDIINLAGIIYREIIKRVKENKMKHEFNPEEMAPYSKELYELVSKSKTGIMSDLEDSKLINEFKDKTIIKDFISIVGSFAEKKKDHAPNDIDLLVRLKDPTDFIKRAIEVRICKDLGFSDKIHFIWGDPEGPHDSFIPLYDLRLDRVNPASKVEMNESIKPMKPSKRFYQLPEVLDYMFGGSNAQICT